MALSETGLKRLVDWVAKYLRVESTTTTKVGGMEKSRKNKNKNLKELKDNNLEPKWARKPNIILYKFLDFRGTKIAFSINMKI
jgi:hypothetical protein